MENDAAAWGWTDVSRIAPGYRADLVVLFADPATDVKNVSRIEAVCLNGEELDRSALLACRPGGLL